MNEQDAQDLLSKYVHEFFRLAFVKNLKLDELKYASHLREQIIAAMTTKWRTDEVMTAGKKFIKYKNGTILYHSCVPTDTILSECFHVVMDNNITEAVAWMEVPE